MEKFAKETYERFAKMLKKRQIIVVSKRLNKTSFTFEYKIIGSNGLGNWDFTPLVAYETECKTNDVAYALTCRGKYSDDLIYKTYVAATKKTGEIQTIDYDHVSSFYAYFRM